MAKAKVKREESRTSLVLDKQLHEKAQANAETAGLSTSRWIARLIDCFPRAASFTKKKSAA